LNRKDQLLIYSLGRTTTPYEAAKNFFKPSSGKSRILQEELGAWYTCKKKLLDEGLVTEKKIQGKSKLIKANLSKYFDLVLKNVPDQKKLRKDNLPLFKECAPRIVDFLMKNDLLNETHDFSYPFVFFLFARHLATIRDQVQALHPETTIDKVQSFVKILADDETKRLSIPLENQQENLKMAFSLLPLQLFKEVFMELGTKVFAAILFRKQQVDWLIKEIADGSEKKIQYLIEKMNEFDKQEERKAEEEEDAKRDAMMREERSAREIMRRKFEKP
jgi:hypothetical protein